jgi:photosynthetic reaction center cytochrome c subunit
MIALVCLLGGRVARGQAPAERAPLSDEVFKNVQVLKGIPVNEFMGTMGIFSASLGMSCEDCHAADDRKWENFAVDNARKRTARRMILMMADINKTHFDGRQVVTCYACHRGADRPKTTPDLAALYGMPPPDPNDLIIPFRGAPPAAEVLDKYLKAIGGAERIAALKSYTAKGTSVGYGPESQQRPVEIYAQAPDRRATIIRTGNGDSTTVYDGRNGWLAAPLRPVPVLALDGKELEGLKLDAELAFPTRVKEMLSKWRVGIPTTLADRDVQVVQGETTGGAMVTLYFDDESGLLLRQIRYADSPVGRIPTQVDYSDYRDVSGVKLPFKWTTTWLDGRDTFELTELKANVPIDPAKFAKPRPPTP